MKGITLRSSLLVLVVALGPLACAEVQDGNPGGSGGNAEGAGGNAGGGGAQADLCAEIACDDENDCTDDVCSATQGECVFTATADGGPCDFSGSPGRCSAGVCADAELCVGASCDDDNDCTNDTCNSMDGDCVFTAVPDGEFCDFGGSAGQCAAGACADAELCLGVVCEDGNDCTIDDVCDPMNGQCVFAPVGDGTACDFGGAAGVCNSGTCEDAMLCSDAATRCDDDNECTTDTCDPVDGRCTNAARTGLCSSSIEGLGPVVADCIGAVCVQRFCDSNNDCDDNRDCTTNLCDATRCTNPAAPSGTSCNGGTGRCFAGGICIPDFVIGF